MIIVILVLLGLCFGSFVNALVYRLYEQTESRVKSRELKSRRGRRKELRSRKLSTLYSLLSTGDRQLSIITGRSMCPSCGHQLMAKDLVPVLSWLWLHGKCRYCRKPISWQYPIVELLTAALFLLSYIYWPLQFNNQGTTLFAFWLVFLVGLITLAVYDLRWYLLPNKIVYTLLVIAVFQSVILLFFASPPARQLTNSLLSALIGGGLFYLLFQISKGKWIGGGDVKLGALLGLILADPGLSLLMIFGASLIGSIVSIPLLVLGKVKKNSRLPFGPFLITGTIIARLFGASLIAWYKRQTGL